MSLELCRKQWRFAGAAPTLLRTGHVCAGLESQRNICFGDSGGPLLLRGVSASEDVQLGVISFSFPTCALPGMPGVFTFIPQYRWVVGCVAKGMGGQGAICARRGLCKAHAPLRHLPAPPLQGLDRPRARAAGPATRPGRTSRQQRHRRQRRCSGGAAGACHQCNCKGELAGGWAC